MMQKFSKRTLKALVATNTLALLLSGPLAAIGPAVAQPPPYGQSPYPPPSPYPSYPQPGYTPAPVPAAPQQPGAAPTAGMPADLSGFEQPWPREIVAGSLKMMVYQPQVESWNGNILNLKAAVGINVDAPNDYDRHFGAIWITARTDVDKDRRAVWLAEVQVTRANFPTAPLYARTVDDALDGQAGIVARVISLDQLETSLAIARQQRGQEPAIEVLNDPPRILFSMSPAVLVTMDGEPVLRAVAPNLERVINTNALLLREASSGRYFLRVAGYWATAAGLEGPWSIAYQSQPVFDRIKQLALSEGGVDILDDDDQPGPYGVLPDIYVSGVPAELLQTDGEPQYAPIGGTRLLYVQNTASDIFVDTGDGSFYVLISGRWFRAPNIDGPWAYVDSTQLPADFRRIPEQHPKGSVLASIAGTPQAEEAVIANSIPQTATIDRQQASFTPVYDGQPQFVPVEGTPMRYAFNSPVPIIMVDPHTYYALQDGVWFTAPSPEGPWIVAPSVPPVIYTIPPASPIYYATYVRVYGATPRYVYCGYTPGYFGTYVTRHGTVVYGSGYRYRPWIGRTYYARPATYGVGAGFASGTFAGFALGLATAAILTNQFWGPHWDGHHDGRRDSGRDRDYARSGGGRQPATVQRTTTNVTITNITRNVYNNWDNRTVVRQSAAQPVAAPANLRERQAQVQRLRAESQTSRERAAATRQATSQTTSPSAPAAVPAARNDVFVGPDGTPYRQGSRGPERLDERRHREAFDPSRRDRQRQTQPAVSAPAATQPAPAVAPAAPAVVRPAAPAPVATPRVDDQQQRRAAEERRRLEDQARRAAEEKARQDRAAAEVQRRQQENAARIEAEKRRQQEQAARIQAEQRRQQEQAAKAQAEQRRQQEQAAHQRAEQERAARSQAEQQRRQAEQAQREQMRRQQQATPPPPPQPQAQPPQGERRQLPGQGGGRGRDKDHDSKKSDEKTQ
jgi:hypothetical protein